MRSYFLISARTAFEKLTDYDYRGTTYYSVRNLSLYECQGWCREEPECQAAAFSFVVNPLAPMQDTLCQLQNETASTNPAAQPQRAANMYYMTKLQIRSGEGMWTMRKGGREVCDTFVSSGVLTMLSSFKWTLWSLPPKPKLLQNWNRSPKRCSISDFYLKK